MQYPEFLPTERTAVTLCRLTLGDAFTYFAAVDASRERLSQFGDQTAIKHPDLASVVDSITDPPDPNKLRMGIWDDERFTGAINLTPREEESAEIGYWLAEQETGKGYATLATAALARYAKCDFSRVYAKTHQDNDASQHVLERAGFHFVAADLEKVIFEFGDTTDLTIVK